LNLVVPLRIRGEYCSSSSVLVYSRKKQIEFAIRFWRFTKE
jgi:hypothetical protein